MEGSEKRTVDGVTEHKCPECGEWYEPEYKNKPEGTNDSVEDYEVEQHLTGICSNECWLNYTMETVDNYDNIKEDTYLTIVDFTGENEKFSYPPEYEYKVVETTSDQCTIEKLDETTLDMVDTLEWDREKVENLIGNCFVGYKY